MTFLTFLRSHKKLFIISAVLSILVVIVLAVILTLVLVKKETTYKAAVVTNGHGCSDIGIKIMEKGGNAVDAAIAALFCEGISMPQTMGIGGGFLMTIYNRTTREVFSLNSRETAPAAATEDMFHGDADLSIAGGLSVGIPAELRGYWRAYNRLGGGVPWRDLIQPSIDMCRSGILVTNFVAHDMKEREQYLHADPVLREIFIDPLTNTTYLEGQYYTRPRLAKTLEVIAEEGGDALHNGSLTEALVKDIRDHDGIITVEDMNGYEPQWQTPVSTTFLNNQTLYSAPLPGSGTILTFILNILDGFLDASDPFSLTNYQRMVESFKFAYARRSDLGDEEFVPNITELISNLTSKDYAMQIRQFIYDNKTEQNGEYYGATTILKEDHGTAHISVLSAKGDAVSVTSTINYKFGARFASNSTGIILNDQMDDFSSPNITNIYGVAPSPSNFIKAGKRPMSSTCPSIIVDGDGDVLMVVGAAGGTKITTSMAQVIVDHLWFGLDMKTSSNHKRLHHQLYPMTIVFESAFAREDTNIPEGLQAIGHNISFVPEDGFTALTAITTNNGKSIVAVSDKRRPGSVSYWT